MYTHTEWNYMHTTTTHRAGFQSLRGGGISSLLLRGATPRAACMMVMNFLYFMLLLSNSLATQQHLPVNQMPWRHLRSPPPPAPLGSPFLSLGVSGGSADESSMLSGSWVLNGGDRVAVVVVEGWGATSQKTKQPCSDLWWSITVT